jgi:2'-5' RNA ligase
MRSPALPRLRGTFERTQNHWWWRKGWGPGTRYLTWHLTFEGATALHDAAERAGAALRAVPGIDVVPIEWLHLTMSGLGHTDEFDSSTLEGHIDSVLRAASGISVSPLVFDRLFIYQEGVCLSATSPGLQELRTLQSELISAIGGPVHDPDEIFHPHVSLGYFSREISEEDLSDTLDDADLSPVAVPSARLSLIEIGRDNRVYTWRVVAQQTLSN